MMKTSLSLIPGYTCYILQTYELCETLPITKKTEFWLTTVTIFGTLSMVDFTSVHSK